MAEAYVRMMHQKYGDDDTLIGQISSRKRFADDENEPQTKRPRISSRISFQCEKCGKKYTKRNSYYRHVIGHKRQFRCDICAKVFTRKFSLLKHMSRKHKPRHSLDNVSFTRKKSMNTSDRDESYHNISGGGVEGDIKEVTDSNKNSQENGEISALQGNVVTKRFIPQELDQYDLLKFFAGVKDVVRSFIISFGSDKTGARFSLNTCVEMVRDKPDGTIETSAPHFRSRDYTYLTHEELQDHDLNEAFQKMYASFEEFIRRGSSWVIRKVLHMDLTCATYSPLRGRSYIKEPLTLRKSGALINVKNHDDRCFMYSVLAQLHPAPHNPCRVQHYEQYAEELNFSNIAFPVPISKISHFETLNQISVNVFGFEEAEIFPIRITKFTKAKAHVNLLYLKQGDKAHYVLIKNLNKFLHRTIGYRGGQRFFCHYCLQAFTKQSIQTKHTDICKSHGAQKVEYPSAGVDDILEYDQIQKQFRCPFVIYADFETFNSKLPNEEQSGKNTRKTAKLDPCAFGYQVVSINPIYTQPPKIYRGPDASTHFIDCMLEEQKKIMDILSRVEPMTMTDSDIQAFETATRCNLCGEEFTDSNKKCRDHCHLTGNYRQPLCNSCNLNFQNPDYIPIFFHGLSNFDGSILCQSIGKFKHQDIKVIPRNSEKYISFSLGKLRFLDSYRFLSCSLEELVENLKEDGDDHFVNFNKEFKSERERELLLRKGIFPYDYLDGPEKFHDKQLPPKDAFYNRLSGSHITDSNYNHALDVWQTMNIENFGQYLDLYLKTDVLLLADVFEKFRNTCLQFYGLDPANFYTAPNLSWVACLKMTGVQLELLTDPDQHLFFERAIRGGVAMVSKRYGKANHPGLGDKYDPNKSNNYIMMYDFNNLYGHSMSQSLPVGNFRWLDNAEIEQLDIVNLSQDEHKGYMLEVDLHYDKNLHDFHNDFPLAPEKKVVLDYELSPYCRKLHKKLNPSKYRNKKNKKSTPTSCDNDKLTNRTKVEKLIPTLSNKKHYVVHYRTLQLYLQLGLRIEKIHRVLEFDQKPWLKEYIDFNTTKRKEAKNNFEKDFFKLMNNAVFGKTMENLRLHQDVRLAHTVRKLKKLVAKSTFESCKIFNEDLVAVSMRKHSIKMIRPIYTGAIILDLSKLLVYDFFYNYLKKQYGENVDLIYTDTDSFILDIRTEDVYRDMEKHLDLFDTSNFPRDHPLYSPVNAKVVGKMKDESNGQFITEVVALRPKMYSYIKEGKETKKAKGIVKNVVENKIRHSHYKECLETSSSTRCSMNMIRSELHKLYTIEVDKTGLSAFEDKRYILNDSITSYAYGHYRIPSL